MSVATITRVFPALKFDRARWRAVCDLSPWIASQPIPAFDTIRAMRSAPCFVREKTSTERPPFSFNAEIRACFFSGFST